MKTGIVEIVLSFMIIFWGQCEIVLAQPKPVPDSYELKTIVPPSPNAASLGKYADMPVGYHTGTPNISIPLYELKEGDISLPIALSYHASGVRVAEVASWVGLGWSLHAGGVITRSAQHVPDEGPVPGKVRDPEGIVAGYPRSYTGYYKDGFTLPVGYDRVQNFTTTVPPDPVAWNTMLDAAAGNCDTEPDIFFFNIGGYSGKFLFKVDVDKSNKTIVRTPLFIPRSDVKVEVIFGNLSMPRYPTGTEVRQTFIGFVIITPDGFRYHFGGQDAIEYTGNQVFNLGNHNTSVAIALTPSSWYLTRIESPAGRHIDLEYSRDTFGYYDLAPERCWNGAQYLSLADQMISRNVVNGVKLSRISSSTEAISFKADIIREDLGSYENSGGGEELYNVTTKRLDRIEISELNSRLTRRFVFSYDYFRSLENSLFPKFLEDIPSLKATFRTDRNRLRLDKVTEVSGDGSVSLPPYVFTYIDKDRIGNPISLPRRMSYQQDHWGYFNRETMNKGLISFPVAPRNNRRQTNDQYTQVGTLKSIRYPLGGITTFNYESHEAMTIVESFNPSDPGRNYVSDSNTASGNNSSASVSFATMSPAAPSNECLHFPAECNLFQNITLKFRAGSPTGSVYNLDHSRFYTTPAIEIYRQGESKPAFKYEFSYLNDCAKGDITCSMYTGGQSGRNFREISRNVKLTLPPGQYYAKTYRYEGKNPDGSSYLFTAVFNIQIPVARDPNYKTPVVNALTKVGGLRIKSIVTSDGVGMSPDHERVFSYPSTGGVLFSRPQYYYDVQYLFNDLRIHATIGGTFAQIWSSSGTLPMRTVQGSPIGYAWVKEEQTGNGYKIFSYDVSEHPHHFANNPYFQGNTYNYQSDTRQYSYPVYPAPLDLERGNLLSEEVYNSKNKLVMSTRHYYEPSADMFLLNACKVDFLLAPIGIYYVGFTHYPIFSSTNRIRSTTVNTNYDDDGSNPTSTTMRYDYDGVGHLQASTVTKSIDDTEFVDRMIFPPDYGSMSSPVAGIKNLVNRNMINKPIERYTIKRKTGEATGSVIDGSVTTFKPDRPLPDAVYSMKISKPLSETALIRSNISTGSFNPDPSYERRITYHNYDYAGNISELSKEKDMHVVYLWGYSNTRIIAEVRNASLNQVFHTSFEDIKVNTSDSAFTGKRSWAGSYIIAPPSAGTYRLSYWLKSDLRAPWSLRETTISGSTTIGGAGMLIDEVRIHPHDARMITYTYDIPSGVRSINDANNLVTRYNYDALGRLQWIKDHNGYIQKSFSYKYDKEISIVTRQPSRKLVLVSAVDNNNTWVTENIQYFDGLGRPLQTVDSRMSPLNHDVVQPFTYDKFGREARKYLPYVSLGNDGRFQSAAIIDQLSFYEHGNNIAVDTKPFIETVFDSSPLNRVLKQGSAGESWQPNSSRPDLEHVIVNQYALNTVADSVIRFNSGRPLMKSYYPPGTLYRNTRIDEDKNDVVEFKDKLDRLVCKRVRIDSGTCASTYYVYDELGNLNLVVSPEGARMLSQH